MMFYRLPVRETTASRIVRRLQRWDEIETAAASPDTQSLCVGSSREWNACLRTLVECALYGRVPVLLTGESGTGKELAARLLHAARSSAAERCLCDRGLLDNPARVVRQ